MSSKVPNAAKWQDNFLRQLANPRTLLDLFDCLPGVYMYIKDVESRFVRANRVVCDVVGVTNPDELVGRTDFDYFPPAIASQYVAEDQRVIRNLQPLTDQVWMVPGKSGVPRLYLCSKIPLQNRQGDVVGIAGVKRPYEHSADDSAGYSRLMNVIAFVTENYAREIEVSDMAAHVYLSVSQLQREFSKNFGITPIRYLREVRIGVARHLLESSDLGLSQIASQTGFYDQSHLTRHFKSSTGLTPLKYRQRFRWEDQLPEG
ncbi:MAG: AraC family transcriptional regulator [Pirellulales bacterium]|nr:AraC family transcriptional regulator [Pirellulales bacterium]